MGLMKCGPKIDFWSQRVKNQSNKPESKNVQKLSKNVKNNTSNQFPPAIPQLSKTGALPGARQGLNLRDGPHNAVPSMRWSTKHAVELAGVPSMQDFGFRRFPRPPTLDLPTASGPGLEGGV